MKEITGELFEQICDGICITTNAFVKKNGRCVVGRGCAKQSQDKWPDFDLELARNIRNLGNVPAPVLPKTTSRPYTVISFPVKPASVICNANSSNVVRHMQKRFKSGQWVPGWAATADLNIIADSARGLVALVNHLGYHNVVLPRPGCGAGELNWEDVSPILNRILDDRFSCITFK